MLWLVDDDPDEMFLVRRALLRLCPQCDVQSFEVPQDALDILSNADQSSLPLVIVSDLNMPGWDGAEFLRQIETLLVQKDMRVPKLVLISAAIPDQIEHRTAGIQNLHGVLTKPDLPQDLAKVLAPLLCTA